MQIEQLGPYKIGRQLGRGGMGTVFEAVDSESQQSVAVKVLSASLGREDGFRERFEAEIESLRKLKHANIVRLLGYGENEGQLFYAMELVDGRSLEEELRRRGAFAWTDAVDIGIQVCHSLRHAHDRGVIHRDIKPANLLLAKDNVVKLSDFGIAKLFGASGLTADGGVIGTAEFMAPEQADGRPVTFRCDLYSLGCVVYTLLAGRPPFRAASLVEMLQLQRYAAPEPVRRFAPETPPELEVLLTTLMDKDADKRLPNAQVLARRFEVIRQGYRLRPKLDGAGVDSVSTSLEINPDKSAAGSPSQVAITKPGTFSSEPPGNGSQEYSLALGAVGTGAATRHASDASADEERKSRAAAATSAMGANQAKTSMPNTRAPTTRFTMVDEEEHRKFEHSNEETPPWVSAQTWVLVGATAAMGMLGWWLLQPPSADRLYARIEAAIDDENVQNITNTAADIGKFRSLYSSDPRLTKVEEFQETVDLYRLRREFEVQRRTRFDPTLSSIERALSEAIKYMDVDPAVGAARLEAIIEVYGEEGANSAIVRRCVQLAERQLDAYRKQVRQFAQDDRDMLSRQFERANRLASVDPATARICFESIIVLYADKPWTAETVAACRDALANLSRSAPRMAARSTAARDDEPIVAPP